MPTALERAYLVRSRRANRRQASSTPATLLAEEPPATPIGDHFQAPQASRATRALGAPSLIELDAGDAYRDHLQPACIVPAPAASPTPATPIVMASSSSARCTRDC